MSFLTGDRTIQPGGRTVPGVMVRVAGSALLEHALEPWGVVRDPTAEDVLDQRLSLPKPLRGWRILAFAVVVLAPILVDLFGRL